MTHHQRANLFWVHYEQIRASGTSYPPAGHRENRGCVDSISGGRADPTRECLPIEPRLCRSFYIATVWKIERFSVENDFVVLFAFEYGFSPRLRFHDEQPRWTEQNVVDVEL